MSADLIARGMARRAQLATRPRNNRIACLGDSNTFINWGDDPTTPRDGIQQARGYAFWAQMLSGARVRFLQADNFGVSGETSVQIAARADSVIQSGAGACILMAGTNDRGAANLDFETSKGAILSAATAITNANILTFLFVPPPIGNSSGGSLTVPQLHYHLQTVKWIKDSLSLMQGGVIVDPWEQIMDATSGAAIWKVGMTSTTDAKHFNPLRAYEYGRALAGAINAVYPAIDLLPKSNADQWSSNAMGLCLNTNPMMAGVAGTVNGSTTTPNPGNAIVADGYVLSGTDVNLTMTASKVTSASTGRTMQRLTVGGMSSVATSYVEIRCTISIAGGRLTAGDQVVALAYVEMQGGSSNLSGMRLGLNINSSLFVAAGDSGHVPGVYMPTSAYAGILVSPPIIVPTGTITTFQSHLRLYGTSGVAPSGSVDIGPWAVRKVI